MNNLIACQPSAIKAVRLQCLVPPHPEKIFIRDLLGKDEVTCICSGFRDPIHLFLTGFLIGVHRDSRKRRFGRMI